MKFQGRYLGSIGGGGGGGGGGGVPMLFSPPMNHRHIFCLPVIFCNYFEILWFINEYPI